MRGHLGSRGGLTDKNRYASRIKSGKHSAFFPAMLWTRQRVGVKVHKVENIYQD
jgi:hypothetical protein